MAKFSAPVFGAALAVAAGWAATCLAEGTPLAVKPGLWEVTSTDNMSGAPPIPDDELAKLTPEQRAQLQAAMSAAAAQHAKPRVFKECLTEEKLKRGFDLGKDEDKNCKKSIVQSTSKVLQVHMECTGEQQAAGDFRFDAVDPATVTGKTNVVVSQGAKTMKISGDLHAKWLGADCGSVKPGSSEAE
jgi:hypothetical protein